MSTLSLYPTENAQRDQWILERRPERKKLDAYKPYTFFVEQEPGPTGEAVSIATIFLTNSECPWRCVMCDLWKNTLTSPTPKGAIPKQIEHALSTMPPARQIKLYNSGSFFDRRAIPREDYPQIASLVAGYERVIVECHPSLIGDSVLRFRDLLSARLEIAMGLETAHPEALSRLNKRFTLEQFAAAASRLEETGIDLRVFILVQPPFVGPDEALFWAERSLDLAFDCGAVAATLIPTRGGNGAMEELARIGEFTPPRLWVVEAAAAYGLRLKRGRVFVDLWDIANLPCCPVCRDSRIDRLRLMNLSQQILSPIACTECGGSS